MSATAVPNFGGLGMPEHTPRTAEQIARAFHAAYEDIAPELGYKTRPESAVAWEDIPELNRAVMVATVERLQREGFFGARSEGLLRPDTPPGATVTCEACGGLGQDDNAPFFCHECDGTGRLAVGNDSTNTDALIEQLGDTFLALHRNGHGEWWVELDRETRYSAPLGSEQHQPTPAAALLVAVAAVQPKDARTGGEPDA